MFDKLIDFQNDSLAYGPTHNDDTGVIDDGWTLPEVWLDLFHNDFSLRHQLQVYNVEVIELLVFLHAEAYQEPVVLFDHLEDMACSPSNVEQVISRWIGVELLLQKTKIVQIHPMWAHLRIYVV